MICTEGSYDPAKIWKEAQAIEKKMNKMFVVEWFHFVVDEWIRGDDMHETRASAERQMHRMTKNYNPNRMTGFNPKFVRIAEVN